MRFPTKIGKEYKGDSRLLCSKTACFLFNARRHASQISLDYIYDSWLVMHMYSQVGYCYDLVQALGKCS